MTYYVSPVSKEEIKKMIYEEKQIKDVIDYIREKYIEKYGNVNFLRSLDAFIYNVYNEVWIEREKAKKNKFS